MGTSNMNKADIIQNYINFSGNKSVSKSPSGLLYAIFSHPGSYRIPSIAYGDTRRLVDHILGIHKGKDEVRGICMDVKTHISNICNYSHAQDIPAVETLREIVSTVDGLGTVAYEYQVETRNRVEQVLIELEQAA